MPPFLGRPSRPVSRGQRGSMPTAGLVPRGPGPGRGDKLGSRIAEIQPAEDRGPGRSQRRRGWHSERLENILTLAARAHFLRPKATG